MRVGSMKTIKEKRMVDRKEKLTIGLFWLFSISWLAFGSYIIAITR